MKPGDMATSDRRSEPRPESPARRRSRRAALWLNLAILVLDAAILIVAARHRRRLDTTFERIVKTQVNSPYQIAKIRSELASMDLTRESLDRELQARLAMARGFEAAEFYLAIDTANRRLRLQFGPETVRETSVIIGEPQVINAEGKTWRFVPLKGAFTVAGKLIDAPWSVPAWVYVRGNTCGRRSSTSASDGETSRRIASRTCASPSIVTPSHDSGAGSGECCA